jgi:YYY domain-containing protein
LTYTPDVGFEIGYAILWWVMLQGIGWLALPLAFRLFRHLPDRGYTMAKPLGLILVSYALWMLSTLGFLRNTWGSILLVLLLVLVLSIWLYRRGIQDAGSGQLGAWLRANRRTVLVSELVFAASFALWTWYKAYDPNIAVTEKPMEFAFLNAIVRSERFPAYDPWMSGYGISYYHLGYIMVATLSKLGGIPTSFAFNLGIATLFALTASGAFGVVYNMVHAAAAATARRNGALDAAMRRAVQAGIRYGLLAAIIIPLMGNLEGALEFLHANGVGVTVNEPGYVSGPFWEWIDIKNLTSNGTISDTWYPTGGWWWWRASRLIHDKGLTGSDMEVIDEFPAFSFLLGDMHPHVLAYPFVFLVLALALNLLLATAPPGAVEWWLVYLCLGAIGFLNTWDMPFYFFILVVAYGLNRYMHPDLDSPTWLERVAGERLARLTDRVGFLRSAPWLCQVIYRATGLALASVVLYLPYWIYGRPQAGAGILPNLFNVSRLAQLFLMFGTFWVVLVVFLVALFVDGRTWVSKPGQNVRRPWLRQAAWIWGGTMLFFPALLVLVLLPAVLSPSIRTYIDDTLANPQVQQFLGPQTLGSLLRISLRIRLGVLPPQLAAFRIPAGPWAFLFLSLLIAAVIFWFVRTMFPRGIVRADGFESLAGAKTPPLPSIQFALLMAFTGLMLVFSVEFVYLRDAFGTRMNTVFKFYFQAWALLGLAAAFGAYYVLEGREGGKALRSAFSTVLGLLVFAGLLYPLGTSISRTGGFSGPPTLNGCAFVARDHPDEYAAIQWLNRNVAGHPVIVESVRGSFAYEYARISSRTGLPAVMGWTGHEGQWHGLYDEIARREQDVNLLYSGSIQDAQRVLDKYDITFVYVGYLERAEFQGALAKFDRFMDVAFEAGDTVIYQRRGA